MSKEPSNKAIELLEDAVEEVASSTFRPNEIQRKAKARFWYLHSETPFAASDELTASYAFKLTGVKGLQGWWKIPGFSEWFLNETEFAERVQYLNNLALDALEEIVMNTDPKAQGPRVNAIKVLLEVGNKMPSRWAKDAGNFMDKTIASMDKVQLVAFLEKNGVKQNDPITLEAVNEKKG